MKNEKIILEIRIGEGGNDAKLLIKDMLDIYIKSAKNQNFEYKIFEERDGYISIWLKGNEVKQYYANEIGLHKFIRIPPTEKRGRTQTSTISVAISDPDIKFEYKFDRDHVVKSYIRGSGNGGQAINKTNSCCQLVHKSGIVIRCQDTRDRSRNEEIAWKRLEDKIKNIYKKEYDDVSYSNRFVQIGYGNGRNKRTYRIKEDIAMDHNTGKKCSFREISKGKIELLF